MDEFHVSRFGGGLGETAVLPFTWVVLFVSIVLILILPKRYVVVPFLISAILIPLGQVVVIGPIHFPVFRILIMAGWVRLLGSGALLNPRQAGFIFNTFDRAIMLWVFTYAITFTILYQTLDAFKNRLGFIYNVFGAYFLLRFLINSEEDVDRVTRTFALICSIVAIFMIWEQVTGRNHFSVFGGVSGFTPVRGDKIRSQGPFGHSILAGTFGAVLSPLFIGMYWQKHKGRLLPVIGIFAALVMIITCSSSTPLMGLVAALVGLLFWRFRRQMRLVRWGILFTLVGLHLVMKAPVWALIARIDLTGSSSGYHRYMLIDQTIRHFGDWWLYGIGDTSVWGYDLGDTSNEFVEHAVTGGLPALALFLTIIGLGFRRIGLARKLVEGDIRSEKLIWTVGVCLFAMAVAFFGVSFFDQTTLVEMSIFAMIPAVTGMLEREKQVQVLPVYAPGEIPQMFASRVK